MAESRLPSSLEHIAQRVEGRLDALLRGETERWAGLDPDLLAPLSAMRRLVMAGGKRLRPAFCHWGFVGAGGDPDDEAVVGAGAALEMLHTFALIHDDVMDGSPLRRGFDTVHRSFGSRHLQSGWRGEDRRFGEGVAILVGNLAFVYADRLLADAPRPAWDVFTELRLEVNLGQYLDLLGTARGHVSVEQARRIGQYKSGKYTVERPLHLGAALAGRLGDLEGALSAYGAPLGEAFQLRDDLLGAFGDSSLTGKPVGDDLREGRPTALYAYAARTTEGAAAKLLGERFGQPDLTESEVSELQGVFEETGARHHVEVTVDRLVTEALVAIDVAPITPEARVELVELASFVAGRDR
ncbi:MAG: polyprenyl synthetase family protein [Actinomycetota bacterium]|nr:polyprenyl synthetase family protein [Actinomycetota bacterium]MDQ3573768.1 polyprenyl synthetase family protein [Actinomycetota bacterium]